MMKFRYFIILTLLMQSSLLFGQTVLPSINPSVVWETPDGDDESQTYNGAAPLHALFYAKPENADGWKAYYEWRFIKDGEKTPYLIRYEEDTDFTFVKAGTHYIKLYAEFVNGSDTVRFDDAYWEGSTPISVNISESKLEMPNAFSPNGDGINDIYKAKDGYQSIVSFNAVIMNRWGQKLFEWNDPASGWDGKYNGKDVKQGVYFVFVKAVGADGKKYNIRRDVNLLRGYYEDNNGN